MTNEEFDEKLNKYIQVFANIITDDMVYALSPEDMEFLNEAESRGLPYSKLYEKAKERVAQIDVEKTQKRENDPEGYNTAKTEYENAVFDFATIRLNDEKTITMDQIVALRDKLFEYEPKKRSILTDVFDAKKQFEKQVEEKMEKLEQDMTPEQKESLDADRQVSAIEQMITMKENMRYDAKFKYKEDDETFLENLYQDILKAKEEKARLEGSIIKGFTVKAVVAEAIKQVKLSRSEVQDASNRMEEITKDETQKDGDQK